MLSQVSIVASILLTLLLGKVKCNGNTNPSIETNSDLQIQIGIVEKNVSASIHSRRRRYVVFPEGSTFTMGLCLQYNVYDPIFSESVNWALSFDLPNETRHVHEERQKYKEKAESRILSRDRRQVFQAFEALLSTAGFDGRLCLLRTICETAQLLPPRQGVVQELIRLLFTYPLARAAEALRPGKHRDYALAHSQGLTDKNCIDEFPCPISLLDLLLRFATKPIIENGGNSLGFND